MCPWAPVTSSTHLGAQCCCILRRHHGRQKLGGQRTAGAWDVLLEQLLEAAVRQLSGQVVGAAHTAPAHKDLRNVVR